MTIDVVNQQNEKVGTFEIRDGLIPTHVDAHLIWESVVRDNAAARRGTHATKTRGLVSGSGRKPWKQKGTGRARVGEARNPLWRKGGTVFGPQPRSYEYALPRKVERAALRAALAVRLRDQAVIVVDQLTSEDSKTKSAAEMVRRLAGDAAHTLLLDLQPDEKLERAVRNLPDVVLLPSGRLRARDLMHAQRVVATRAAIERLQEVLAS